MDSASFFKEIPGWPTDKVRQFLGEKDHGTYNLVDVRQPEEYEEGHLPGARLIPLGELASRSGELDRKKPTITYCRSGNRSRVAAATLIEAGFNDVYNMEGGIRAWKGLVAGGPPDAGMAVFPPGEPPEMLVALAWSLEEGSRRFYAGVAASVNDAEAARLFQGLVGAEEHHKAALVALYREITGKADTSTTPETFLPGGSGGDIMEGGMRVDEALAWTEGKETADILDLSIALESNAYDLYLKMERAVADKHSKGIFNTLAEEERQHLNAMTALIETRV